MDGRPPGWTTAVAPPKIAELLANDKLRGYVQDRLAGVVRIDAGPTRGARSRSPTASGWISRCRDDAALSQSDLSGALQQGPHLRAAARIGISPVR
jgi:hypothetical protein